MEAAAWLKSVTNDPYLCRRRELRRAAAGNETETEFSGRRAAGTAGFTRCGCWAAPASGRSSSRESGQGLATSMRWSARAGTKACGPIRSPSPRRRRPPRPASSPGAPTSGRTRSGSPSGLQLTVAFGYRQHGHAFQPEHHRGTTVVVHLGPFYSCPLTPRIMRPQALFQAQPVNRVDQALPRFITIGIGGPVVGPAARLADASPASTSA